MILKKYSKKYFLPCLKLIENTWEFGKSYTKDASIEFLKMYLGHSNYKRVLVLDDKIVGLIFANLNKNKFNNKIKQKSFNLIRRVKTMFKKNEQFLKFREEYNTIDVLFSAHAKNTDASLNLFIVSGDYQGMGIGRKLMTGFTKKCRDKKVKNFMLWTDYDCNYKFYDNNGFDRVGTFTNKILKSNGGKPNGLIYYKSFDKR